MADKLPAFINPNPGFCRTCNTKLANKRHQYCTEHRAAKSPPTKRSRAARIGAAKEKSTGATVIEIVRGDADGGKATPAGTPTRGEWQDGLARLAVAATWGVGMDVTRGEPRERRGRLALELSMTDAEAEALTKPIAHRIHATKLNEKHGRKILEALALAEPMTAMMQYLDRVHEYRFERAQADAGGPRPQLTYQPIAPPAAAAPAERSADDQQPADSGPHLSEQAAAAAVPPVTGWTGGAFGAI